MLMHNLIDPKKRAEVLGRIKRHEAPFCAEKPVSENPATSAPSKSLILDLHLSEISCGPLSFGVIDTIDDLLKRGANINSQPFAHCTPLMHAAAKGHADTANFLITRGADVNLINLDGHTALWFAREGNYDDCIKVLKEHGAKE